MNYDYKKIYNITKDGIEIPDFNDILEHRKEGYKNIYNLDDEALEQNTPDGQKVYNESLAVAETNEALLEYTTGFDIEQSEGRILDRNVAFKGLKRKAGKYTYINIEVETIFACNLNGIDTDSPFTISDSQGNQFYLEDSINIEEAGTHTLIFRASDYGEIIPILNDITIINTPISGVVSVINNSAPLSVGDDEETDEELKSRFNLTTTLTGLNDFESCKSHLLELKGVEQVDGEDNDENTISQSGTLGHSVWFIVLGGNKEEIGEVIKSTIGSSCGQRGEVKVPIKDLWGNIKEYRFDRPQFEDLYIKFDIQALSSESVYDEDFIKEQLINNLKFQLRQQINSTQIDELLKYIDNNFVYTNILLSKDGENYSSIISNTRMDFLFSLKKENIIITEIE